VRSVAAAAVTAGLLFVPLASAATFGRPAEIPLVRAPASVAVVDATQDGAADVVVANASGPVLTLLPGRRDGSFERPLDIGTGAQPRSIAVGDFDNDGGDEVAVAGGSEIALYVGVDASLVRHSVTPARSPSALDTADLDSDGNLDLIAGSATDALVAVFRGLGDGTFASPPQEYAVRRPATSLLATDLNADDVPDVAVSGDGVSILFGNDDGTLREYQSVGTSAGGRALAAEDFDSDGLVDLALAHGPNVVTVIHNDGEERFANAGAYQVGGTPVAIDVGDVDGDATSDIATVSRGSNDVSVLLGAPEGSFRPQSRLRVGRTPVGLALQDVDDQGTLDLVTANRGSKTVTVFLNGADAPQPVVCLVPRVARRKLAVAQRLVAAANCRVLRVRRTYSNRVRRGRVIAVKPLPGTRLARDSSVTLLVSRGPRRR
jgi:hypothetical protein